GRRQGGLAAPAPPAGPRFIAGRGRDRRRTGRRRAGRRRAGRRRAGRGRRGATGEGFGGIRRGAAGAPAPRGPGTGWRWLVVDRGPAVAGAPQVGQPAQFLLAGALFGPAAPAPAAPAGLVRLFVARHYRSSPQVASSSTGRSPPGRTTVRNRT